MNKDFLILGIIILGAVVVYFVVKSRQEDKTNTDTETKGSKMKGKTGTGTVIS